MSTREVYKKASQYYPSKSNLYQPTVIKDSYEKKKLSNGRAVMMKKNQGQNIAQKRVIVSQAPSTQVPSDALNGGSIDFRLERGQLHGITSHILLKMTINNDTGGLVDLPPTPFWIDRVELYSDNGGVLLNTTYGNELWLSLAWLSRDEFEDFAEALNTDIDYRSDGGNTLAINETRDFYVILSETLKSTTMVMGGLKSELLYRVYFQREQFSVVNGAVPRMTNSTLLLKGLEEPADILNKRRQVWLNNYCLVPYCNWIRMTKALELAPSSNYEIVLSGLQGITLGLFIVVRDANFTASQQADYSNIFLNDWDIVLSSGDSMIGFYKRNNQDIRLDYAENFQNRFQRSKKFTFIPFSNDLHGDVSTGNNSGCEVMTSFERLTFTTNSLLPPGSYRVDIYSINLEQLIVNQGRVTTSRS